MINKIWGFLIISGILFSIYTNNLEVINKEILESATAAFEMVIHHFPIVCLWLGIMNIASASGLLEKLTKFISPALKILFPEIPKNHESLGLIASSIIVNLFGLGNAATPIGLKAMKSMQEINLKKDTASRSMITFLIINTTGLTIIPTTVIALRAFHGSQNPTEIISACIIATLIANIAGLIFDRIMARMSHA